MKQVPQVLLTGTAALMCGCAAMPELPTFTRKAFPRTVTEITLPNPGFEDTSWWQNINGGEITQADFAHSGNYSCRLNVNNPLIKTPLLPVARGEILDFEAYSLVDNLCTILAEMEFYDKDGNWLKRSSGQLARGDQYSWQRITGSFENTENDVAYVTLQFYGGGHLDDVKIRRLSAAPAGNDREAALLDIVLPETCTSTHLYRENDGFKAWISRETGLLSALYSKEPDTKVIQPAGTNSMQIYLHTADYAVDGDFNIVVSMQEKNDRIIAELTSSDPATAELADAVVTYDFSGKDLQVKCDIRYKKDDPRTFQAGMRSLFRANEWDRNIAMTFPITARHPEIATTGAFFYKVNDDTRKTHISNYPCSIAECDDRYLLWGSHDLGKFAVLSPNDLPWRQPSMLVTPVGIKAGDTSSFEIFYSILPKADNTVTQVMYDYIGKMYSSLPLMKDLLYRRDFRYSTNGAFAWYHPTGVKPGYDGWRQSMLDRNANNVWYSWWTNWDEVCPTEGEWVTYDSRQLSAEGLKEDIQYMKSKGLNVYLYFRQFLVEEGTYEDKAPYKAWLGRDAEGKRIPFIDFPVPKPELVGGLETIRWTAADFSNPDYREWYIDMVKRAIDYYQPSGIAWDMGFSSAYGAYDPETGIGNGTLYVQAVIRDWAAEKYPEMRIATNESFISPTALMGDSLLIEGAWDVAHKDELTYQIACGHDLTLFSLQLTDDYIIQGAPEIPAKEFTHLVITARAENISQAHIIAADLFNFGFKDDGTWQTIKVPIDKLTALAFNAPLRLAYQTVIADENGNGVLEIADARFVAENDPDREDHFFFGKGTPASDFVMFGKWMSGKVTTGEVTATENGVRFTADQPGGCSGGWLWITPVKEKWVYYQMKILGLGAICSDAQVAAMTEINKFAANAAAMRRIAAKKVIYDLPENVFGTIWTRDANVCGAIFNDNTDAVNLQLRLKKSSFPAGAELPGSGVITMQVTDPAGLTTESADFAITDDGEFYKLTGELSGRSLLTFSNFK